ncbi:sugar kinase [Mangrovivirga cuniculi]|uniref:2-dehydro-3-deoxygluconokinase n=1 Tax=Mangrovivirga cuniculi TaxID=2715131 RepID=A0A4D7JSD0_9BACT|nr:sugar kinase [Mangrovivirga cuniculi]QCK16420.1 2-dehydro-3-deoxygluconokinase [Mangrovivirga cuniculi]
MNKIVTFGEIMMRLGTPGNTRFEQSNSFDATFGGGEANVSVSLSHFGLESMHITRFPDNAIGHAATNFLRSNKVDVSGIQYGGERIGLYFLETGGSVRPSKIIYDRKNSAFDEIQPGTIDWDSILDGATWFHWTGISPAISKGAAVCCKEAIDAAHQKGITVSGDLNYRKNLWRYGKTPQEVMPDLISKCDLLIASPWDAENIMGITTDNPDNEKEEILVYSKIMKQFPKVKKIINTKRTTISSNHNLLIGQLFDGKNIIKSKQYEINPIVDRIGGGDAFVSGYIYGNLILKNNQEAIEFAVAASVLKHTIEGDVNITNVEEVNNLIKGNTGKLIR